MQRVPDNPVNRAIRDSADSLDKIEELMGKLTVATENLLVSSKRLEYLTKGLYIVTIFLAGLTIIELLKEVFSFEIKAVLIIVIFIITGIILYKK